MSDKVETFFITPLESHFEAIPKDGPRDTIITDLEQYAPDDLMEAAEWLKRARQAQSTFPSPKECIKAIKAVVGGRQQAVVIRGEAITASNYAANALAYVMANGAKPDKATLPVIRTGTAQWDEWIDYYRWLGVRWILALLNDRDTWTVPAEFPGQFDRRFSPAQKAAA